MIKVLLFLIFGRLILIIAGALLIKFLVKKYLNRDIQYIKWLTWISGIVKEGFINIIKICKRNECNK